IFCCWRIQADIAAGLEFWSAGPALHESISPGGVENQDATRIGTKILPLGAVWGDDIGRDERPSADELVFEGLLLAEGGARKERKPQACDRTQTQKAKTIHGFLLLNRGRGTPGPAGYGPPVLLVAPEEHVGFLFFAQPGQIQRRTH